MNKQTRLWVIWISVIGGILILILGGLGVRYWLEYGDLIVARLQLGPGSYILDVAKPSPSPSLEDSLDDNTGQVNLTGPNKPLPFVILHSGNRNKYAPQIQELEKQIEVIKQKVDEARQKAIMRTGIANRKMDASLLFCLPIAKYGDKYVTFKELIYKFFKYQPGFVVDWLPKVEQYDLYKENSDPQPTQIRKEAVRWITMLLDTYKLQSGIGFGDNQQLYFPNIRAVAFYIGPEFLPYLGGSLDFITVFSEVMMKFVRQIARQTRVSATTKFGTIVDQFVLNQQKYHKNKAMWNKYDEFFDPDSDFLRAIKHTISWTYQLVDPETDENFFVVLIALLTQFIEFMDKDTEKYLTTERLMPIVYYYAIRYVEYQNLHIVTFDALMRQFKQWSIELSKHPEIPPIPSNDNNDDDKDDKDDDDDNDGNDGNDGNDDNDDNDGKEEEEEKKYDTEQVYEKKEFASFNSQLFPYVRGYSLSPKTIRIRVEKNRPRAIQFRLTFLDKFGQVLNNDNGTPIHIDVYLPRQGNVDKIELPDNFPWKSVLMVQEEMGYF